MVEKSVLLVWVTLICGRVLVHGKPQVFRPSVPSSSSEKRTSADLMESSEPSASVGVGSTNGFELSHGYSVNAATTKSGAPYSSGWTYVGGRAGPGPTYLTDATGIFGSGSDLWSGRSIDIATTGMYLVAGAMAGFSAYHLLGTPLFFGGAKKSTKKETTKVDKDKDAPAESEKTTRRRRRDVKITQADTDLTRLASIVLNAIASGECLQKTICQIGTQVGESPKGRLAFSLIDTLLPPAVHTNQYFITMKKSLKGEQHCERFNCKHA